MVGVTLVLTEPRPMENQDQYKLACSWFSQLWDKANKICIHAIGSTMTDTLYDVYMKFGMPVEIWDVMNKK